MPTTPYHPRIFVNLPVTDLASAMRFYEAIGFTNNPMFTDDTAAAMVLDDHIHVMLLTRPRFEGFAPKPMGEPAATTSVLIALTLEHRENVDAFVTRALAAGGSDTGKSQDFGAMYSRTVTDPDGNVWEPFWMDMAAMAGGAG